jgi:hypothetical protein
MYQVFVSCTAYVFYTNMWHLNAKSSLNVINRHSLRAFQEVWTVGDRIHGKIEIWADEPIYFLRDFSKEE